MLRILVIDDDPFILRMVDRMLGRQDCGITLARSGPEGIGFYHRIRHDLVISDMAMPVSQGLETIRELRTHYPSLPILAISGGGWLADGPDLLEMARHAGATQMLPKPFTSSQLAEAVSNCLSCIARFDHAEATRSDGQ